MMTDDTFRSDEPGGGDDFCQSYPRFRTTDWLAARQDYGLSGRFPRQRITVNSMASTMAWNPRRMQNMILVVGPGTPATACWDSDEEESDSDSVDSVRMIDSSEDEDEALSQAERGIGNDEEEDSSRDAMEEDESNDDSPEEEEEEEEEEDDDDDDDEANRIRRRRRSSHLGAARFIVRRLGLRRRLLEDVEEEEANPQSWLPSIRHGGCINTAAWLNCPWRLSTANEMGASLSSGSINVVSTRECPTQLITSGDDRMLKFWDVRDAMGSASPLAGGYNTLCPFSTRKTPDIPSIRSSWKEHYRSNPLSKVAGSVIQLASMSTSHRGNVFHVLPVDTQPGKVLTCGADGYLRLCDLQTERSTVVIHPEADDELEMPMLFSSGMAFSHHLLSANTGLLCSERGLHRFDLRLSPREQSSRSLLLSDDETSWRTKTCKSCAVWHPFGTPSNGDVESSYVFAGGASEVVCLYDLRMDGSQSRILQKYKPFEFESEENEISVSGLDISKDGRELLVSYESDQIYAFPIVNKMSSSSPTLEEIEYPSKIKPFGQELDYLPEMVSYGGHLNRFTFLKNAMYAGPNDEYICTGSDSGHAWIYERATGTVVSLLGADSCTCNGVIPHPSLPVFVTYGIDSTAKLWRAAEPVDCKVDDSPAGRVACSKESEYEMSPVARTWDGVQTLLKRYDDTLAIMPDYIATSDEVANSGRFSSSRKRGIDGYDSPRIGNAMRSLPSVIRQNRYECYRSLNQGHGVPVNHDISDFDHRVRLMRLRHQADRLGLPYNPNAPWVFKATSNTAQIDTDIHPADLVPDNPSDWITMDADMVDRPSGARDNFNSLVYGEDILAERYSDPSFLNLEKGNDAPSRHCDVTPPWLSNRKTDKDDESFWPIVDEAEGHKNDPKVNKSRRIFLDTVLLLKEGGNHALKEGSLELAARRYDKAIQYCAVAFMEYTEGSARLSRITHGHFDLIPCEENEDNKDMMDDGKKRLKRGSIIVWSPLLKVLVTSHLNMALLLLKPELAKAKLAADQAISALELVAPFVSHRGRVYSFREGHKHLCRDSEPVETFAETKPLQAKGYFRLGCAEMEMGEYKAAIKSFECSIKATAAISPNVKPDSLVARHLQEAKRKHKQKKRRCRKKFQKLLSEEQQAEQVATDDDDEPPSSSASPRPATSAAKVTPGSRTTADRSSTAGPGASTS